MVKGPGIYECVFLSRRFESFTPSSDPNVISVRRGNLAPVSALNQKFQDLFFETFFVSLN